MSDDSLVERVIERAMTVQQVPAPTFAESARAALVKDYFETEHLTNIQMDEVGNVLARLPGTGDSLPLILSAHLDTVFPDVTDLTQRRDAEKIYGPGIGDNSLGVAALFGVIWGLRLKGLCLPGDIWLAANVCEEGLGDLRGMRAVVDRFGEKVQAYVILEGMALGQVFHRGLGVRRYRINANTRGGHSWVDYGQPSAIHELAGLVVKLNALQLPKAPRTSLNVGKFVGGTSVNTIAAQATLELDLRSEGQNELAKLIAQVEGLVGESNQDIEIRVSAEVIGQRPAGEIPSDHPLVRLAVRALLEQGIAAQLNVGSTDANLPLSRGYPAVTIGLTYGAGAHTVGEFIETRSISQGLAQLFKVVEGCFRLSES
jgi:tripeptide aminopeptidase